MNDTVLLVTGGIEFGLAVGYALEWVHRFLHEGRVMVLGFAEAYIPTQERT